MGLYCDIIKLSCYELNECLSLSNNQEKLYSFLQNDRNNAWLELDKAWHGIHFLLKKCSNNDMAGFLIDGGKVIQNTSWRDIYGVDVMDMRCFKDDDVKKINSILQLIPNDAISKKYNPPQLNKMKIYPDIWEKGFISSLLAKRLKSSSSLDYILFYYLKLRKFIKEAAEDNLSIIIKYHQ